MSRTGVTIPEKLFFKIGEVCELAGVQAHVLRYWESEFPMLAPQKNRAGQRVYRKRDVEMALRIKELLYEDQYTIAGAKKRLTNDVRPGIKSSSEDENSSSKRGQASSAAKSGANNTPVRARTEADRKALRRIASDLREVLALLDKQKGAKRR